MRLRRELGLLHVFCIASGAMISSGIFVLPGLAHALCGPAVVVSYVLAGLLAMVGMLSIAELATAMPKAGGDYFYATRGLGPAVGTVAGLLTWFTLSLKSAFALVGMAAFAPSPLHDYPLLVGLVLCAVFVAVNLYGTRETGQFQVFLVIGLLLLMLFYVVRGLPAIRVRNLEPFAPQGTGAMIAAAGFVFVAYGGLLKISSVAEEVRDPSRVIPRALILSLVVVGLSYAFMVLVTTGVLPDETLNNSLTPISDGAEQFMGRWGRRAMSLAAVLAFVSTANAGIMAASRYVLALSRDELAPAFLGRVHRRFGTPHVAVLVTGLFVALALFLKLRVLVSAASTVLILSYVLSCLCVIVLRESRVQNYQPSFRAPLYPWLQIAGVIGFSLLLFEMGPEAFAVSVGLIVLGFLVYWFYGRDRVRREYALLHLVERITSRDLVTGTLESELKDIIRERDEIVMDRFDHLVESCPVRDFEHAMSLADFFRVVADAMAEPLEMPKGAIIDLLHRREAESSTVLTPELAIPHIVVEVKHAFSMLVARCRGGIHFSREAPNVQAVFVLMGSRHERNFHLRALAAIAQIVQDPDFIARWLGARGEQALRDILLLGQRRREEPFCRLPRRTNETRKEP